MRFNHSFPVKFREKHDGATYFVQNQLPSSKKGLKVESDEGASPTLLRDSTSRYIQPNSLWKDRDEYISRAAMNEGEQLNLLTLEVKTLMAAAGLPLVP